MHGSGSNERVDQLDGGHHTSSTLIALLMDKLRAHMNKGVVDILKEHDITVKFFPLL
jgi:hypothetical protein